LAIAGCAAMPLKEGPTAALLPGIEQPRDRNDIDITIHEVPVTPWGKCLGIVGKVNPMLAAMSVLTLSPLHGCARVARDRDLDPGQKPWCIIAVPKGNEEILEHELRHCEGWDHPRQQSDSEKDEVVSLNRR
jgi:hypothetical protein